MTVVTAARTAVATVAADGVARGSADGGGGKDGADSPLGVDGNIVGTKAENFHCECSTTPHINGLGSVLRVHGLFLDQSASTLRAPGTVFFLRPFRALPRLLSLARRGVGRPRVMLVMQAEDQNPRHVPGVSCFRTCRECRRLASMPVPSPRGRQVQAQLAVALEKGLSLGGERPSPVASPDSSSPTGIWNGIANLSFGDSSQALVCQVADQEPQSQQRRRPPPGCCGGCYDARGAVDVPATVALPACGHVGLCAPCAETVATQAAVAWATPQSPQSQQLSLTICPICRG